MRFYRDEFVVIHIRMLLSTLDAIECFTRLLNFITLALSAVACWGSVRVRVDMYFSGQLGFSGI